MKPGASCFASTSARLSCAWLLALALAGDFAAAQNVYRCGPGHNVYSQQPCTDGTSVDVRDPRSAAQRDDARTIAARERKQADQLTRAREMEAAKATPATAAAIEPSARTASRAAAPASQPASSVRRTRHIHRHRSASAPNGEFTAIVPGSGAGRRHSAPSASTR